MLKIVELFAGTGAFSLAFEATKLAETVYANDIVEASKKIFDANFAVKLCLGDIHDVDPSSIPSMDILTAGFPCQPFSIAGKKEGFSDTRSNVFWKMVQIIEYHKPKCLVLENVKNLLTHDKNRSFEVIKNSITALGYSFDYRILNTSQITSIPQNRERLYMICFLDQNIGKNFVWPAPKGQIIPLSQYLLKEVPKTFYYSEKSKIWNKLCEGVEKDISTNTLYQYRRFYLRENKNNLCPTLTANMGSGGHNVPILKDNNGIRKLTPRECFMLQGFPETYKLDIGLSNSALYKLAGNAVSVAVVEQLATAVARALAQK